MTKEELLKAMETSATVETLYKNEAYIIEIEVGDMPKEHLKNYLEVIADRLHNLGIQDFILAPTCNGQGRFKFYRLKDKHLFEVD